MRNEKRVAMMAENNKLGLKEFDLVQTTGKGIGIVLFKQATEELVVYSMSSVDTTHPTDGDGMAKVRRYNEDGTIAQTSETTGKNLKNRDVYTITGICSYDNPVLAMKDFVNQNESVVFDDVVIPEPVEEDADEYTEDGYDCDECDECNVTELAQLNAKFDKMLELLSTLVDRI